MPGSRNIRAGRAYVELSTKDRLSRGLKRAQARLAAFGRSAREIGARLAKASAVMSLPLVAGAKVYADFERQLANVSTMLDAPEKHMDRFRSGLRRMAVEFGESTDALAGGLYDILSASVPAEKALDVLTASVKAAKAGLADTKTAADAITTILNAYGLEAERAGQVSDLLFSVVRRGKTTFAELAPQVGMVASTAASAGIGLDELGAALATLTRNGVRTENAVTAVNQILMSFLKPSKEAAGLARDLGFEMSSATLKSEGLVGVFEKASRLPPDAIAKLFPNARALRGVVPALKNVEGFARDVAAMNKAAGATDTAYRKMAGTLSHAFSQIKEAGLAALSVVGEALAEPLARAAGLVKRYAGTVIELLSRNKALIVTVAKVVAAVGAVGAALVAAGVAGSALATVFGGLASIVGAAGTVVGVLGSALAALLSPIGLVIAGVAGLGTYLLYATGAAGKALAWLKEKFGALADFAGQAFQGIKDALAAGDFALAARILWLTLKVAWEKGTRWLLGIWLKFKHAFLKTAYGAFYGVLAAAKTVWHGIQVAGIETAAALLKTWQRFVFGMARAFLWVRTQLAKAWNHLKGLFDETFDPAAANRAAQARYESASGYLAKEAERRLSALEAARKQVRAEERADYEAGMAQVSREYQARKAAMRREARDRVAAAEAELAAARQEWQSAIADARGKRAAVEASDEGPGTLEKPEDVLAKVKGELAGVSDALRQTAERTFGVRGTFSALESRGLGAGGATDRIARASEETAKNTRRLVTEAQMGGLTFE